MPAAKKSSDIGLRMGTLLCNMPAAKRKEFIAEGLPQIFESAASLVRTSQTLEAAPREAEILAGHAEEECAKILILIDIMRCPPARIASRIGPMMRWFYNHLARLLYAEAQGWYATDAAELQRYIDNERRSHYLEGEYSEFIMPNWTLFRRETTLYADIAADEHGEPQWITPSSSHTGLPALVPMAFQVVDALAAFGVFTAQGLGVLHEVWSATAMVPETRWEVTRDNYRPLAERLDAAGLISERATEDHAGLLAHRWQMPMYELDFSQIPVPLEDLVSEREAQIPYEY